MRTPHAGECGGGPAMSDTCPLCGAAMLFVPPPSRAENAGRCANCDYWDERVVRYDGAVLICSHMPDGEETWANIAVGYELEEGTG